MSNDDQKGLECGAMDEVRKQLHVLCSEIVFLSGIIEHEETVENVINCSKCLLNIHEKFGDAFHLVQYYSILSSSASRPSLANMVFNIGSLEITFPPYKLRISKKQRILNNLIDELNSLALRSNSLLEKLLELISSKLIPKNDDNYFDDERNQSQMHFNTADVKQLLDKMVRLSEDNVDTILILRNIVEWDYEKGCEMGKLGARFRLRWIKSLSIGNEDLNDDLKSISLSDSTEMISIKSRRPIYQLIELKFIIGLAVILFLLFSTILYF